MNIYPWLDQDYLRIIESFQSGLAHHALLFSVVDDQMAERFIHALSLGVFCQHPNAQQPCLECHNCRLMLADSHPDYHHIGGNSEHITVDMIRDLATIMNIHAQQDGAKIIWLENIEIANLAAANALLKMLEEPSPNTYFFITSHRVDQLLPTIRSRCLYWPLSLPDQTVSLAWLAQQLANNHVRYTDEILSVALKLSLGNPLNALELLSDDVWQYRQQFHQTLLQSFDDQSFLALLPFFLNERKGDVYYWLITLFMDAMKYQQQAFSTIINQDNHHLIQRIALTWSHPQLLSDILDKIINANHQRVTVQAINLELLAQALLLEIAEYIDK